jgi:hypothetical protein
MPRLFRIRTERRCDRTPRAVLAFLLARQAPGSRRGSRFARSRTAATALFQRSCREWPDRLLSPRQGLSPESWANSWREVPRLPIFALSGSADTSDSGRWSPEPQSRRLRLERSGHRSEAWSRLTHRQSSLHGAEDGGVRERAFPGRRESSRHEKAASGVFKHRLRLFPGNSGEPSEEVIEPGAGFEVLEERPDRYAGAAEDPGSAGPVRDLLDGGALTPVQHRSRFYQGNGSATLTPPRAPHGLPRRSARPGR